MRRSYRIISGTPLSASWFPGFPSRDRVVRPSEELDKRPKCRPEGVPRRPFGAYCKHDCYRRGQFRRDVSVTCHPVLRSNSMSHAIRFHRTGGPEVLTWEEVQVGKPGPGEARIRHTAVGLNFVDIYNRSGVYPVQLPSGLGGEAAGVVEEVGSGVTDLKPGDRIAYGAAPMGAYAEARLIPADRLLKLPDGIDDKAALAKAHGCAHTIVYTREDFSKRVDEITGGKKVPVVYDSVGKDTFLKSLDCLAPLGVVALFGQSSGSVEPLNLGLLAQKGSLYVTRPTLNTYAAKRESLVAMAKELFEVVQSGAVKIEVNQSYPLKDAAKAHADLAARKTTGSTVLTV